MTTTTARLFGVLALSATALSLSAAGASADPDNDWNRGRPDKRIEIYVDAGHDRALEQIIGQEIARSNRGVVLVNSPRYADVTVTVNGRTSNVYTTRRADNRYRYGYAAMDYDYRVTVRTGKKKLDSDRIRGRVVEPLNRYGYFEGGYEARPGQVLAGVLISVITGRDGREAAANRLERELTLEAYQRIADEVADMRLPQGRGYHR
jgi:hypothetical protein